MPDPHKYGWTIPELLRDLSALNQCETLNIQGLMTILPLGLSPQESLAVFEQVRDLAAMIQQQQASHLTMQELSMGMSGDYQIAIQAGATMVRLGQIIFGERTLDP